MYPGDANAPAEETICCRCVMWPSVILEDETNLKKENTSVDGDGERGEKQTNGEVRIRNIGRINRSLYKNITSDIITDDVILTDKQIQHIKERHGQDYERFLSRLHEAVAKPDYIFKDAHPNTALVIKSYKNEGDTVQIALRLATSDDPAIYKNSIITYLRINKKRLQRYIRNREILYKD